VGSIEPFRNHCVLGLNFDGAPYFDARVFDFVTGKWFPEVLRKTQEYVWLDDQTFAYSVVEPQRNWAYMVKLHRLGTSEEDDIILFEVREKMSVFKNHKYKNKKKETDGRFSVDIGSSISGRYLFVGTSIDNNQSEWMAFECSSPLSPPILIHKRTDSVSLCCFYFSGLFV
jgi:protease II